MKSYTICLVGLSERQTVVIGGGQVARRKTEGLLSVGARIKLISPALVPDLQALADLGKVEHIARAYMDGDLKGAFLVVAATDDASVNEAAWREANRRGCLINVADDPLHSNFILPAAIRRGEMTVAICTGGNSPALARRLRERFETLLDAEYETLTEIMGELRPELIQSFAVGEARLQAALRIVDSDILDVIKNRGRDSALAYARERLRDE